MTVQMILLPLFVEVLLTLGLVSWLGFLRKGDIESGVRPESIALREPNWRRGTLQVAYSYANQFELPVLFYVLTILALITKQADLLFVILAWIFVLTRFVHAYVHTTNNVVLRRGMWFGVGAIVLLIMWLIFIVRILAGG